VHFLFVVRPIKNTRQTKPLPCAWNKAHGKDLDARQRFGRTAKVGWQWPIALSPPLCIWGHCKIRHLNSAEFLEILPQTCSETALYPTDTSLSLLRRQASPATISIIRSRSLVSGEPAQHQVHIDRALGQTTWRDDHHRCVTSRKTGISINQYVTPL
jgi:hypothetical protein